MSVFVNVPVVCPYCNRTVETKRLCTTNGSTCITTKVCSNCGIKLRIKTYKDTVRVDKAPGH